MKYAALLGIVLLGCSSEKPSHHENVRCEPVFRFPDQTRYDVYPDRRTDTNIDVDASGLNINLAKIDRLTNEVEKCLLAAFPDGNLPPQVVQDAKCQSDHFQTRIRRECLTVKVGADWFLSKYEYGGTHHQQLPYTNGGMCTNKGLPAGVCYYRAGIQDDLTIAVPPSFYLYKDPLVRITTGCTDPWFSSEMSTCMEPTTDPLGDGSEP